MSHLGGGGGESNPAEKQPQEAARAKVPPELSSSENARVSEIGKRITVAMITMNEEGAVGKVIGDIQNVVPDAEILIVDSSSDRTAEIAQALGARVIKQFPPRGYGPAMDRALHASEREVVVTLDCDDTYPVEFIEPMARMAVEDG